MKGDGLTVRYYDGSFTFRGQHGNASSRGLGHDDLSALRMALRASALATFSRKACRLS
jgi:hypothetical protein